MRMMNNDEIIEEIKKKMQPYTTNTKFFREKLNEARASERAKCIAELEKLENTKEHPAWNTAILTAEKALKEMDKKG